MPEKLMEDFLDLDPFAAEVKRHPRTVRRWLDQPNGLPYTRIGNRILIHVPTAREWIFGRMRNQKKRARGRANREWQRSREHERGAK
jgi:hypothetical protein